MARNTAAVPDGEEASPTKGAKKKRGMLLPAIVLAAGLLGGGYFMNSSGAAKAATPGTAGAGVATSTTVAEGPIVTYASITLNLADGRYLKVGVALQLSKKASAKAATFQTESAKPLDMTIAIFGDKSYAQLSAPGGRERAKQELRTKLQQAYPGDILTIYFTEFVMQ